MMGVSGPGDGNHCGEKHRQQLHPILDKVYTRKMWSLLELFVMDQISLKCIVIITHLTLTLGFSDSPTTKRLHVLVFVSVK